MTAETDRTDPVDAFLLVSFGGPEGPDDVIPFLENVTRGRGIPPERLAEVGAHYAALGGVSPLNAQNRALLAAVERELADHGMPLRCYWGNRNWSPYLADAVRRMRDDGVRRAVALVTSAYSSYSGCRQYAENLAAALAQVEAEGRGVPRIEVLRRYFDHPGFVAPLVDAAAAAVLGLSRSEGVAPADVRLVFTTHSIPTAAAEASGPPGAFPAGSGGAYVNQHRTVAGLVADGVAAAIEAAPAWDLVYQSRSGPPAVPWLEPDVADHLDGLAAGGTAGVVLVPIGFLSDHVEVVWDLDVVALGRARELGLPARRAATVGTDPRFVAAVRELVAERVSGGPARALSALGPWPAPCPADCCRPVRRPT